GQSDGFNGFSSKGLLNGDAVTDVDLASTGSAATANVGNYTITASNADGTGLSNYDITYVDGTLSIGKAGLTITANNGSKTYGQSDGFNGFSSKGLLNGDAVTDVDLVSTGSAATANVGNYTITASNADGTGLSNYDITYVDGTLSIGKAGLTITANNGSKTYGQGDGFNGFSSKGLLTGDAVTDVDLASTGSAATANVGNYTITASNADGTGLSNYDITYVDGTLSIGKAGLTITANNGSKTYGQGDGFNGFSSKGLVNGDAVTDVDLVSTGSAATANVGNYTITASNADGSGLSNYDITYVDGTLSIGKAGLTITANNGSKTYGQGDGFNGFSSKGLLNGDTVTDVDLASTGSAATANVGNYTITASNADGTGLSNYDITYVDGTLSIGKAGLTITANNGSKTYGQGDGFNGFSSKGLLNGDTVTDVDLASTGSAATANVGNYTITASNADGNGLSNYDITYVDGTLSISKAGLTISANNTSKRIGQLLALDGYRSSGLLNGDSIDSVSLFSDGNNVNAQPGAYTILASDAQGTGLSNYDISYQNGSLQVVGVTAEAAAELARAVVVGRNDAPPAKRPSVQPSPSSTGTGITLPRGICTQLDGMDCLSRQPE
ncbi:MBG domain-containing protein, partial [uncultured Stenotrophomonas sp.]|uniref:beta strand repeat-containing protein n=1 Tax=uncultured Stenotrophomonas sp. TaxID=165438 RepID=UPI0025E54537